MERQNHSEINNLLKILKEKAEANRSVSLSTLEIRELLKHIESLKGKN